MRRQHPLLLIAALFLLALLSVWACKPLQSLPELHLKASAATLHVQLCHGDDEQAHHCRLLF